MYTEQIVCQAILSHKVIKTLSFLLFLLSSFFWRQKYFCQRKKPQDTYGQSYQTDRQEREE